MTPESFRVGPDSPRNAMKLVQLPDLRVAVGVRPVSWAEYVLFVEEAGKPAPRRAGPRTDPVTGVSTADALAYARWLHRREGQRFRLPSLEEMIALVRETDGQFDLWPCQSGRRHGLESGGGCLTEWLACLPDQIGQGDPLRCVVYPAWLLRKGRAMSRGGAGRRDLPLCDLSRRARSRLLTLGG